MSRDITAVFRPDPSSPNNNTFTNITPNSGYCQPIPANCNESGRRFSSFRLPIIFRSTAAIQAGHVDPRQGAMYQVPASWRAVQVANARTGETATLEIRWAGMGSQYNLYTSAVELVGGGVTPHVAHQRLWGGSEWINAPAPCRDGRLGHFNNTIYTFFWHTSAEGTCAKRASYQIPDLYFPFLDFGYELRTPDPLMMSSGQYTGSLTYTVGPGQDVDMGDVLLPNDSAITLHFNLDVDHTLKVDVPPGGNRVELAPQEGWQAWLNSGQKPTRLFRDQRFHISASSRFKMALECQAISGDTCAIFDAGTGHAVSVDVSVSLPNGITDPAGQPVSRRRLLRDGSGTELFQAGSFVDRGMGTLHFEVGRERLAEMLDNGGNRYTGNVTVIWDSEV
ncbi:hypothetical protein OC610_06555 [Pseudomonas sp. SAICEU22]|uniref:Uncharacterized protein n=1 Tax=Pseudomonas agronomica TaxID=2979328 RepID=A0ABT3F4S7_9PSED|nr:hypothetical protein [Pseudomonas agronomica]